MREEPVAVLPLAPGTVMERYTILSVLGQGACGIAYLSQDEELGRRLLLKEHAPAGLCRRELSTGEILPLPGCETSYIQSLSSFLQEASVLAKMRLPAVPEVYEVFEAGGTACSVLSYVEGRDLSQWLAEQPDRRSLLPMVLAEALRAIGRLHRLGVRHRDLKPGHIILDGTGAVNFIDFGVACAVGTADAADLVPAFTPPYSPPEQGVAELECAASDLYSLAVTFYEVTLGLQERMPTAPERLEGAAPHSLATRRALQEEFPLPYLASLDRALSLEPQARYATAEQWLAALTKPAADTAPPEPLRRRRWLWCLGGVCLAAALGGGGYYFSRPAPAEAPPAPQPPHVAVAESAEHSVLTYDLPEGIFCSAPGFCPAWAGECTQIELLEAEKPTEEYLSPVFAAAWRNSHSAGIAPDKLVLVLTDAAGNELARSAPHRYDAEKHTLSFDFAPPRYQREAFLAKPLKELPEGWKAVLRLPLEAADRRHHSRHMPELPLRARQAVFHIRH